jgi:hypothetical protein
MAAASFRSSVAAAALALVSTDVHKFNVKATPLTIATPSVNLNDLTNLPSHANLDDITSGSQTIDNAKARSLGEDRKSNSSRDRGEGSNHNARSSKKDENAKNKAESRSLYEQMMEMGRVKEVIVEDFSGKGATVSRRKLKEAGFWMPSDKINSNEKNAEETTSRRGLEAKVEGSDGNSDKTDADNDTVGAHPLFDRVFSALGNYGLKSVLTMQDGYTKRISRNFHRT